MQLSNEQMLSEYNVDFSTAKMESLTKLDFTERNSDDDFTGYEYEVRYGYEFTHSFNAIVTFNWRDGTYCLVIGNNEGNGFNGLVSVEFSEGDCLNYAFTKTLNRLFESRFESNPTLSNNEKTLMFLILEYPDRFKFISEAVLALSNWLKHDLEKH